MAKDHRPGFQKRLRSPRESTPLRHRCYDLVRALAVKTHENWLEENRYLNMADLKVAKRADRRGAA